MYLQIVFTKKVKELTESLYRFEVSKYFVSDLSKELYLEITSWCNRKLSSTYSYLIIDTRFGKVRINNTITPQSILIYMRIEIDGKRERLSIDVSDLEL